MLHRPVELKLANLRISLALRSSLTSRSSSFTRCASAVVTPSRTPVSTSTRLTHSLSVYGTQPILGRWIQWLPTARGIRFGAPAPCAPRVLEPRVKTCLTSSWLNPLRDLSLLKIRGDSLGYPCRDTLSAWVYELHPETRKRVVGKARGVTRPPELKQAAVIELCTRQTSAQAIAQKLAVSRPTLYKWKNQLLGSEAAASMKPNNDSSPDPERTKLERLVESPRRDVRQLRFCRINQ